MTHAPRHADARVYRALALAYLQPTPDTYRAEYLEYLRAALTEAGAADLLPLVDQMADGLTATPDLEQLTVEYCKLFFGPGQMTAPPYESVYRGGGVLMGEPALQVIERYQEAKVQLWEGFRDCPDRISTELEFLYFTANEAANFAALRREETARLWIRRYREFLTTHLARWVEPFAKRVLEGTEQPFYLGLARLTGDWVKREALGA